MIGRGTWLDHGSDKPMFRVYDYTGATDLFGEGFITPPRATGDVREVDPPEYGPTIIVDGFDVRVTGAGRYVVVQEDGQARPIPVDEYKRTGSPPS